mmetsp:Transcript_2610/g.9463  ORF Transcript_2610/g.9463 Transcript_2610/m.9463 type:complete len:210 (-) Transcript_2610:588-1217(-)
MDLQNLQAALLVGKADLDLHLQAARPHQSLIQEVFPVGHADEKNVVERIHAINLSEELVNNGVVHSGPILGGAALLADGVNLIEDDDVQVGIVAVRRLVQLGVLEEIADVLLAGSDILVEHLGSVHHLGLAPVQHLADLPGDERLAGTRGPVQKHTLDVIDAELLNHMRWVDTGGECAAENVGELLVQTADTQLLEVEVLAFEQRRRAH